MSNKHFHTGDKATQEQAEAGTSDDVVMTPLRTKQAIEELAPGGGEGASSLNGLSDVTIDTPAEGHVLVRDETNFKNRALVEADISDLGDYLEAGDIADFETTTELNARDTANRDADNHTSGTTNKVYTATEQTKLSGVAENANNYTHPNHTGDVTSVGDGATTIANNAVTTAKINNSAVTYEKIQNVSATNQLLGRGSPGAGAVEELGAADVRSIINVEDGAEVNTINAGDGLASLDSAAATKLAGIEAGAQVNTVSQLDIQDLQDNMDDGFALKLSISNSFARVVHGGTAGTSRPGVAHVEWQGSVEPTNAINTDTWIDTSA